MITLTVDTLTVSLPSDLLWSDEHDWCAVEQTVERTITGALIVEAATRTGGRPITLAPEDDSSAWISLEDLTAVKAWADIPGQEMVLEIHGASFNVMFRHHDNGGLSAKPVVHFNDPNTDDFYLATVRLMEI